MLLFVEFCAGNQSMSLPYGLSPLTIDKYRMALDATATFLKKRGVRQVADVTADDLDARLLEMAASGLKRSTRFGLASILRECFRVLQERGLVLRNPALDLPVPDDDSDELPTAPLDEAEVAQLFAAVPRRCAMDLRNLAHLHLLYGCALRLGESLALTVDDIDFGQRCVLVRAGKGDKDRQVPLMKGTAGAVKDYLAVRRDLLHGPDHGRLLLSNRGQPLGEFMIRHLLDELAVRCGIARKLYPHLLRHSIAVHLLRGGADIREVQAFLGHALLETTKVYLRMVPGHLREEYDRAMPEIAMQVNPNTNHEA